MPTGRQVHIDAPLSNLLIAAFESAGDFVAPMLFPVVPVPKQSNKYYTLKKEAWLRQMNSARSPRTAANRIEFDISSDSYFANNYALAAEIPVEDLANQDVALSLRESSTAQIGSSLLRDMEIRVAAKAIANVSTVQRLTGASAWDATNSADIQGQVQDAKLSIFANTGLDANTLILDYRSYLYAKRNAFLLSRFQYTSQRPAEVTDEQLKQAFLVDNLFVARSMKNNANPGQTASLTSIWGPTAMLARVESRPSLMTATYGMSFRWTDPQLGMSMTVQSAMEDQPGSKHVEILEAGYFQDEKVISTDLGFYINTKSGVVW